MDPGGPCNDVCTPGGCWIYLTWSMDRVCSKIASKKHVHASIRLDCCLCAFFFHVVDPPLVFVFVGHGVARVSDRPFGSQESLTNSSRGDESPVDAWNY